MIMCCFHWSQNLYDYETNWTGEWMCFPSFFWSLWSNENVLHVQKCTSWSWSEGIFATIISRVSVFFQEVTISGTLPLISISQLEHRVAGSHRLGGTCRLHKPLSHSLRALCQNHMVLSAELLTICWALRVIMSLAGAYGLRDFISALWPSSEVCAGPALRGVGCALGCADLLRVSHVSCRRSLSMALKERGPWTEPWRAVFAAVPQVVQETSVTALFEPNNSVSFYRLGA